MFSVAVDIVPGENCFKRWWMPWLLMQSVTEMLWVSTRNKILDTKPFSLVNGERKFDKSLIVILLDNFKFSISSISNCKIYPRKGAKYRKSRQISYVNIATRVKEFWILIQPKKKEGKKERIRKTHFFVPQLSVESKIVKSM